MKKIASTSIPDFVNIATAVKVYWEKIDIGTADIIKLFGVGKDKALRIKKTAQALQEDRGIPFRDLNSVSTAIAYEAWGFDISDLEKRLHKLKKLEA